MLNQEYHFENINKQMWTIQPCIFAILEDLGGLRTLDEVMYHARNHFI